MHDKLNSQDAFAQIQGAAFTPPLVKASLRRQIQVATEEILWCYGQELLEIDFDIQGFCREFKNTPRRDWADRILAYHTEKRVAELYWSKDSATAMLTVDDPLAHVDVALANEYKPHLIEVVIEPGGQRDFFLAERDIHWRWKRQWHWLAWLFLKNSTQEVWSTGGSWDIKRVNLDLIASTANLRWKPEVHITSEHHENRKMACLSMRAIPRGGAWVGNIQTYPPLEDLMNP